MFLGETLRERRCCDVFRDFLDLFDRSRFSMLGDDEVRVPSSELLESPIVFRKCIISVSTSIDDIQDAGDELDVGD
jgi:hypothetical protein